MEQWRRRRHPGPLAASPFVGARFCTGEDASLHTAPLIPSFPHPLTPTVLVPVVPVPVLLVHSRPRGRSPPLLAAATVVAGAPPPAAAVKVRPRTRPRGPSTRPSASLPPSAAPPTPMAAAAGPTIWEMRPRCSSTASWTCSINGSTLRAASEALARDTLVFVAGGCLLAFWVVGVGSPHLLRPADVREISVLSHVHMCGNG